MGRLQVTTMACSMQGALQAFNLFKFPPPRYDISNCLFEATYEKVLEVCQCTPYFHWAGVRKHRQFCRGPSLVCQNEIFSKIGEYTQVEEAGMSDTSGEKFFRLRVDITNLRCQCECQNSVSKVLGHTMKPGLSRHLNDN